MEDPNAFIDSNGGDIPSSTMPPKENRRSALAHMKGSETNESGNRDDGGLTSNEINMSFANWSLADNKSWTCSTCTYLNDNPRHLTCAACGTTRNEGQASSSADIISGEPSNEYTATTFVNEGEKEFLSGIAEEENQEESQDEYEAALLEERLKEHITMQQEMLDEIQREREENERKMEELQAYQQRILDKVEREQAVQSKIDKEDCPATDPTESCEAKDREEDIVQDYRRHLFEQKRTLEESSRHLQSVSRLGLVKLKVPGSGKRGSLLRDMSGFESKKDDSSKEEQDAMQNVKNEWMRREEQLRALRNQMRSMLELEEAKMRNTAA